MAPSGGSREWQHGPHKHSHQWRNGGASPEQSRSRRRLPIFEKTFVRQSSGRRSEMDHYWRNPICGGPVNANLPEIPAPRIPTRPDTLTTVPMFPLCSRNGVEVTHRSLAYRLLPKELRDQPPQTLGDVIVLGHHVWIRCAGCSHSAVILPAVLAQLVGYDFPLGKLARRMKLQQCGKKRVRVRAVEPGER